MKRALILTGGEMPPASIIAVAAEKSDIMIAADSGFDTAVMYCLKPDYIVGDMDSLTRVKDLELFRRERIIRVPHEKDDTDTELAVNIAREKGADYITLLGGGGGRLDHLIGILSLFDRDNRPDEWYTGHERVISVSENLVLHDMQGKRVSFFPAGREQCTMESEGLKWPLDGLVWNKGDAGISNEITEKRMKVTMITGRLIMVYGIGPEELW